MWWGGTFGQTRRRGGGVLEGCLKGSLEGVPAPEGSTGSVPERCWKGFQHWKGPLEGVPELEGGFEQGSSHGFHHRKGFQQWFQQGFQQVSYHPFHLHSVLFQATVDIWPQLVQRDDSVAEPRARGDSAACVVDSVWVTWQAREVVTWPTSAAAKPGAMAELMYQSTQTPWYKVLELNVATTSGMKVEAGRWKL